MSLTKCPNCDDRHVCHNNSDSHAAANATEDILSYIDWRAGRLTERLPMDVHPADIRVPAQDIIALIRGDKTLEDILAKAEEEI